MLCICPEADEFVFSYTEMSNWLCVWLDTSAESTLNVWALCRWNFTESSRAWSSYPLHDHTIQHPSILLSWCKAGQKWLRPFSPSLNRRLHNRMHCTHCFESCLYWGPVMILMARDLGNIEEGGRCRGVPEKIGSCNGARRINDLTRRRQYRILKMMDRIVSFLPSRMRPDWRRNFWLLTDVGHRYWIK